MKLNKLQNVLRKKPRSRYSIKMQLSRNLVITLSGYLLAGILLFLLIQERHAGRPNAPLPVGILRNQPAKFAQQDAAQTMKPAVPLPDPRTGSLLDRLAQIAAQAQPGLVNQTFQDECWSVLLDNDYERRTRNFGLLLSALRPEDGIALHQLFNQAHREGRDYADEYARFASHWGEIDGNGVMTFYFDPQNPTPNPYDVHNALKGWGQKAPQAAMDWAIANQAMLAGKPHSVFGNQQNPIIAVLRGWGRNDPEGATTMMNQYFPSGEERTEATRTLYIESLFGRGLEETIHWIKRLPEGGQDSFPMGSELFGDTIRRMRDAGAAPPEIAQNFLKFADAPWLNQKDFEKMADLFGEKNPAIAEQLTAASARPVMQQKFSTWASQNPDRMGEWLNHNSTSALYDLGTAELARSLRTIDPQAAAIWAGTIKDPELRIRAQK